MLRKIIVVLAIALILGSFALSPSASARGDCCRIARDDYGAYRDQVRGLRDEFPGLAQGDVWGHWGAYYGPMVPSVGR
jgi:hypothetical protein